MKNIRALIIGAAIIILMGLACAVNTEAATGKYVKNISEIVPEGEYILEAVEYPKSQTKKIPGYVATPDANGWMGLKKYGSDSRKVYADCYIDDRNKDAEWLLFRARTERNTPQLQEPVPRKTARIVRR